VNGREAVGAGCWRLKATSGRNELVRDHTHSEREFVDVVTRTIDSITELESSNHLTLIEVDVVLAQFLEIPFAEQAVIVLENASSGCRSTPRTLAM
jgi:5,10-methenyltetrahydromethanopterin hydrogenase